MRLALIVPMEEAVNGRLSLVYLLLSRALDLGLEVFVSLEPFTAMVRGRRMNYVRAFSTNSIILPSPRDDLCDELVAEASRLGVRLEEVVRPFWVRGGRVREASVVLALRDHAYEDIVESLGLSSLISEEGDSTLVAGPPSEEDLTWLERLGSVKSFNVEGGHVSVRTPWSPLVNGVVGEEVPVLGGYRTFIALTSSSEVLAEVNGVPAMVLDRRTRTAQIPVLVKWDVENNSAVRFGLQPLLYLSLEEVNIRIH